MTDTEILTKVKAALGVTGAFQDATLQFYIDEVKAFMQDAGVPSATVTSAVAVGCIARGVADLWNYGSGNAKLSEYFKQRMLQLKAAGAPVVVLTFTDTVDDTWVDVAFEGQMVVKFVSPSAFTATAENAIEAKFTFPNGTVFTRSMKVIPSPAGDNSSFVVDAETGEAVKLKPSSGVTVDFVVQLNSQLGEEPQDTTLLSFAAQSNTREQVNGVQIELTVTEARA